MHLHMCMSTQAGFVVNGVQRLNGIQRPRKQNRRDGGGNELDMRSGHMRQHTGGRGDRATTGCNPRGITVFLHDCACQGRALLA